MVEIDRLRKGVRVGIAGNDQLGNRIRNRCSAQDLVIGVQRIEIVETLVGNLHDEALHGRSAYL